MDRAQAEMLIEVLSDERPEDLAEAYEATLTQGPAWRKRLSESLKLMPQTRLRLDGLTR